MVGFGGAMTAFKVDVGTYDGDDHAWFIFPAGEEGGH